MVRNRCIHQIPLPVSEREDIIGVPLYQYLNRNNSNILVAYAETEEASWSEATILILFWYERQFHIGRIKEGQVILPFPDKVKSRVPGYIALIHFVYSHVIVRIVINPNLDKLEIMISLTDFWKLF